MGFHFHRSYEGPLQAVILDWAGTTVDYGSFAPTAVFLRLFEDRGVPITIEQARVPMGLMKLDHLRAIFAMPEVSEKWRQVYQANYSEKDVEMMFADFIPMQQACLKDYSRIIPGLLEAVQEFRRRGMKVGSTTGYTREMMDILAPEAGKNGYTPDTWVSPSDVPAGRPYPWMCYQNAIRLGVYPLESVVKVGDTIPDIEEGLNAGMWTIGLAMTGNMLGLTEAEARALPVETLRWRRAEIANRFYAAGAHYVVDGIGDVPPVLDWIEARLERGEKP